MNAISYFNILVVDDVKTNIDILLETLGDDYDVSVAMDGQSALEYVAEAHPHLILLDIMMPGMDGYEVCRRLKANKATRNIPIIFVTAMGEEEDETRGFQLGAVDYITKPFSPPIVKARVGTHLQLRSLQVSLEEANLHLEEKVQAQVKEIADLQMSTIIALAKLAEQRDNDTGKHIERVQGYCRMLAEWLMKAPKFEEQITPQYLENISFASPLHDIGKVGIEDRILQKPGKLTDEEFEVMKTHTVIGAQTLEKVRDRYPGNSFINMGIDIARSHHEKMNGKGYPDGLVGEVIPLPARIMAIADVYDALRSPRVYKPAFSHEKSRGIILQDSGTHFDPEVVAAFVALEEEFLEMSQRMADEEA